ncbi:serine hydrolase domain-containing protein [Niabella drilacis]|uniref:CubicO group peptidase, beta-lactamase class C family n=1 Tax=Niabella drilacis (strain DSM 25811 / CCM 8410 / CCUG 62505 / LMG 26954 / E90) TaxID=1285928 RepID=A0A1G6T7M2_NIADE|nr:serine hydrolase domain-containing protein [Niabella drilacis]SDD25058.1 CubicO group peptidase, beta-lactamase class C family [Niabella drilacis]
MKPFRLLFLSCWIGLQTLASCGKSDPSLQSKLNAVIEQERRSLEKALDAPVPSISVLVETPNGRYFASSTGKNGKPVKETTWFRFASNTKNFTATAILNMQQEGWLHIDDKITATIPGSGLSYVPSDPAWNFPHRNEITIRQLLQHNAGVYDLTNDTTQYAVNGDTYLEHAMTLDPDHPFTTPEYINVLTQHHLTYGPPNTVYHYSNTGYSILGEIIARIYSFHSGKTKTYADYMHEKITGVAAKIPLGVRFIESAADKQLPAPYLTGMIRLPDTTIITDQENASGHIAEGNGIGTMTDLNRYIRSLMQGRNVLKPETVTLMQNSEGPAKPTDGSRYSLGCSHIEGLGYGHNGATVGYLSMMAYDPAADVSVVVLLPYWDLTSKTRFEGCLRALSKAGRAARSVLGYP